LSGSDDHDLTHDHGGDVIYYTAYNRYHDDLDDDDLDDDSDLAGDISWGDDRDPEHDAHRTDAGPSSSPAAV
jgi:hypothetical protein